MDIVDNVTGEVLEVRLKEDLPFRTLLKHEYDHKEKYKPGSSMIDLTGYEPLDVIIARCTREMRAPGGQVYKVLDVDALKAESVTVPVYEASSATTIDEAFETEDPTQVEDFDLVDAGRIMTEIGKKQVANENLNVESVANDVKIKEALDSSANEADDDLSQQQGNEVVGA